MHDKNLDNICNQTNLFIQMQKIVDGFLTY